MARDPSPHQEAARIRACLGRHATKNNRSPRVVDSVRPTSAAKTLPACGFKIPPPAICSAALPQEEFPILTISDSRSIQESPGPALRASSDIALVLIISLRDSALADNCSIRLLAVVYEGGMREHKLSRRFALVMVPRSSISPSQLFAKMMSQNPRGLSSPHSV